MLQHNSSKIDDVIKHYGTVRSCIPCSTVCWCLLVCHVRWCQESEAPRFYSFFFAPSNHNNQPNYLAPDVSVLLITECVLVVFDSSHWSSYIDTSVQKYRTQYMALYIDSWYLNLNRLNSFSNTVLLDSFVSKARTKFAKEKTQFPSLDVLIWWGKKNYIYHGSNIFAPASRQCRIR
jgi:hypothetical protein